MRSEIEEVPRAVRGAGHHVGQRREVDVTVGGALGLPVGPEFVHEAVMEEELRRAGRIFDAHGAPNQTVDVVMETNSELELEVVEVGGRCGQNLLHRDGVRGRADELSAQTARARRRHQLPRGPLERPSLHARTAVPAKTAGTAVPHVRRLATPRAARGLAPVPIGHGHHAVDFAQKVLVLQDEPAVPGQEAVDLVDTGTEEQLV